MALHIRGMGNPVWPDVLLRWLGHQRWLRYGVRRRVLTWLVDPAKAPDRPFEAQFAGFVYPGNLRRWIDWMVYFEGGYELDELELMRTLMQGRSEPIALDIGANVGHHTLYLASFCHQVHAFEPYDAVGRCIDEKIARNQLQHITVHRVGLGETDQELEYFAPQGHNIGTGSFAQAVAVELLKYLPQTQEGRLSRLDSQLTEALSSRELAVLQLIAQGCSNQEISERLFISLNTVKTHARHINSKLDVERRTQAVARAKALGLLG